jgi:hypothetical protein
LRNISPFIPGQNIFLSATQPIDYALHLEPLGLAAPEEKSTSLPMAWVLNIFRLVIASA